MLPKLSDLMLAALLIFSALAFIGLAITGLINLIIDVPTLSLIVGLIIIGGFAIIGMISVFRGLFG